jgi:PHD/YefM family antitoxin component YafN of YafNO toxin-antitoxin module
MRAAGGTRQEAAVVDRVRTLLHRFVAATADHLVLATLRQGSAKAIVLPEDEYEAFMATLEVEEDAEALDDLRAGRDETSTGLPPTWDEARDEMGLGSHQADPTR